MVINADTVTDLSALSIIMDKLEKIKGRNQIMLFFLREINKAKIDDCLSLLGGAVERFNVGIYHQFFV